MVLTSFTVNNQNQDNYPNKKYITNILVTIALLVLAIVAVFTLNNYRISITSKIKPITGQSMTEKEARVIAEKTCIEGEETLSAGSFNNISKTWWFDVNLNTTPKGCNPACVVSEVTKTAEINGRCTGAIMPR